MKPPASPDREIPYHPFANRYPLMTGEEFEAFKADVEANGLLSDVTLYDGKILDGRNRLRACRELGIELTFAEFHGTEAEAAAFVDSQNLHRRHLTPEFRRLRVQELREQGMSLRRIASVVGIHPSTVADDLKVKPEPVGNPTPEYGPPQPPPPAPPKVTGRDGKQYPATRNRKAQSGMTPESPLPAQTNWRGETLEDAGLFEELPPSIWELIVPQVDTCGVLVDRLMNGETFGLPRADLLKLCAAVERLSESRGDPVRFGVDPAAISPLRPSPVEPRASSDDEDDWCPIDEIGQKPGSAPASVQEKLPATTQPKIVWTESVSEGSTSDTSGQPPAPAPRVPGDVARPGPFKDLADQYKRLLKLLKEGEEILADISQEGRGKGLALEEVGGLKVVSLLNVKRNQHHTTEWRSPLFREIGRRLRWLRPHKPCAGCSGDGCRACGETGYLTKHRSPVPNGQQSFAGCAAGDEPWDEESEGITDE